VQEKKAYKMLKIDIIDFGVEEGYVMT